jgi:hypothetical protein
VFAGVSVSISGLSMGMISSLSGLDSAGRQPARKEIHRKFRFLYLLSCESIVSCRYSGDGEGLTLLLTGSSLRHWPPGTSSKTFVPSFFVWNLPVAHLEWNGALFRAFVTLTEC